MPCRNKEGGDAKQTATSQAEPRQMGLLFVYPERPRSLPVTPVNTSAFHSLEEKLQMRLFRPDQIREYKRFRSSRNRIHYLQLEVFIIQTILSLLKEYLIANVLNPYFMNSQIILIPFYLLSPRLSAMMRNSLLSTCHR